MSRLYVSFLLSAFCFAFFCFAFLCFAFVCFLLSAFCSVTKEELYSHPGWQWCTFEGAELHTLLLGLRATFREKLEWLEEMEELSEQFRANREAKSSRPAAEK